MGKLYREGSVTAVPFGQAKGLKWKRFRRFASEYWLGIHELAVQDAITRELKPGHVFYDVGANVGFFSLIASRLVGACGEVFAFEPLPENASVVAQQVSLNGLANVHLVRAAVGRRTGRAGLVVTNSPSTPHLVEGETGGNCVTVDVVRLDDFVKEHPPPDLVKVDVEGAEAQVLQGAQSLICKRHPAFLIELHGERRALDVFEILRWGGYEIRRLDGQVLRGHEGVRHCLASCPQGQGRCLA